MQNTPFFFGESGSALFGIHSRPDSALDPSWAVLVCNPLGQEAIRAHRTLALLASRLAAAGVHVLRFDYLGTGDSDGDLGFGDPGRCIEDIRMALRELRDIAGTRHTAVLGLRFGATLAASIPDLDADRLILWDPVIDGADYVHQLTSLHERMLHDTERYALPRVDAAESASHELLGLACPGEYRQALGEFRLLGLDTLPAPEVVLFTSAPADHYADLAGHLGSLGPGFLHRRLPDEMHWDSLQHIEDALQPGTILAEAERLFTGR